MRGRRSAGRQVIMALVAVLGLSACRDNGLPDRNLPLQEARHRTYGYPVYQSVADTRQVAFDGRHWAASLPIETIPDRMLVAVGSDAGVELYALRHSTSPHSRLYARAGAGEWRPFLRVN